MLPPEQPARSCSWPQLPQSRDTKEVRQESGHGLLLLHTAWSGSSPVSEGAEVTGDSEPLVPGPPHTTCPEGHISGSIPKPGPALILRPPSAPSSQIRCAAPETHASFIPSTESAQVHPAHPTEVNQSLSKILGSKATPQNIIAQACFE